MRKLYTLMALLVLSATAAFAQCPPANKCAFTVYMTDAWGDGWNGASVVLQQKVAGTWTSMDTITYACPLLAGCSGTPPTAASTAIVQLCQNDSVRVRILAAGTYPDEVGLYVTNSAGNTIFTQTPVTTLTATTGTGYVYGKFVTTACFISSCPLTASPTIGNQTSCGPAPVTFTATWSNPNYSMMWVAANGSTIGSGASFTTPAITASTTVSGRLITDDNTKGRVSGGPSTALFAASTTVGYTAAPAANFTNYTGLAVTTPMTWDSTTVRVFPTANGGTVNFRIRVYERKGKITTGLNGGALLYTSAPISAVNSGTTPANIKVPVGLAFAPGRYLINIEQLAGTTAVMYRSTALPTGHTYPYNLAGLGQVDSVNLATQTRAYYFFDWKMSEACMGPIVTANATFAPLPSTAMPYTVDFNTGVPCTWTTAATSGALWAPKTVYGTASSINGTPFVMVDDDAAGSTTITSNSVLQSPSINAAGYDTLYVEFKQYYRSLLGQKGYVEVLNAAGAWVKIDSMVATSGSWTAPATKKYNVTAYQGAAFKARLRFNDGGTYGWYWAVDDFKVYGTLAPTGNVRMQLVTDLYGSEVSYKITNATTGVVYKVGGPYTDLSTYSVAAATKIDTISLPLSGTYKFKITDIFGDGLVDGTNTGWYRLDNLCSWGNKLILQDTGNFPYDPGGATALIPSYDSTIFTMNCSQPATYVVRVNMNQQTVSTNGVHIAGNFQGWNPGSTPMLDPDGDGIYEYTINTTVGTALSYKFINGNTWANAEGLGATTGSCVANDGSGNYNRAFTVAGPTGTAALVCFGSCSDCQAWVTFSVNMNKYAGSFTTAYVSGTFNNWSGNSNPMSDADGDGIWTASFPLNPGLIEYKFSLDNWATSEQLVAGTVCTMTTGGFTNRKYTATYAYDTLDVVCYAKCENCTNSITLKVDMSRAGGVSADGVHVAGNFQGWNPSATAMTLDTGLVYTVTVEAPLNSTMNFKYINGNTWGGAESLNAGTGACAVNDGSGNYNRELVLTNNDTVVPVICFSRCVVCGLSLDEAMGSVNVYPNPTAGVFTVERGVVYGDVDVQVVNLQGQAVISTVWNDGLNTLRLDGSDLPEGVYFVRLTTDQGSSAIRIAVQH